jgi:thioredoxin-like negative regulator of GroEL
LSNLFQGFKYAVGQVDYMNHAADGVEYTPTFIVYKKGKKVDQFYGANAQQLYDHLWLHN